MTSKPKIIFAFLTALSSSVPAWPGAASAAQPRQSMTVRSDTVKLSDLFSGLEAGQDCDIGSAPAPGRRIVVEQPQLAAIAEQFGVDWQPGPAPARVVLERKARSISRDDLVPVLRSALVAAGASEGSDVSLSSYVTLALPAEASGQPSVESLNYDRSSGRFSADLLFEMPGGDPVPVQVSGTIQEMAQIPVLAHNMNAGSVITPADLQVRRVRKAMINDRTLLTADAAIGLALRHQMMVGNSLSLEELSRPSLVSRGMSVLLRLEDTGLVLVAKGVAIEDGGLDDRIHVLNPVSRAVLVARVTGTGTVQVDPASTPVILATQGSGLPPVYSMAAMTQISKQHEMAP